MAAPRRRSARGISLIEALVALAVMGIGMLGLVGMQSSLRGNSDAAKQRSEAVRVAQEAIEQWRAFATLTTTGVATAYDDIAPGTTTDPPINGSNASFTRSRTVTTMTAPRAGKSLRVDVSWLDRAGVAQDVQLTTVIAGVAPELAASLSVPAAGDATGGSPQGRHRAIPPSAKMLGGTMAGRSGLIPPGATGVAWVFDNVSGLISLCTTTATSTSALDAGNITCGADNALLVSGFLRYALGAAQPTAVQALHPDSSPSSADLALAHQLLVRVVRSRPSPLEVGCFVDSVASPSFYTAFYCAVPISVPTLKWSGTLAFGPATLLASTLAESTASRIKLCRYLADGVHADVAGPRTNQNFLVIGAGDGSTPFTCPSSTFAHQPDS
jgi:Tfp pilus assembly protein PilV